MICCLWSGAGDVVVAKKRREGEREVAVAEKRERESNVREICAWFFFNRWITYVACVFYPFKNGRK